jgi:fucose permease
MAAVTSSHRARGLLLVICYVGFVSLGLPDPLIGVAWPSVRTTFGLQQSDVAWIFFGSGCSYLLSSFFAGRLLAMMNVGVLLAASSALVSLGAFDFSFARVWPLFVLGSLCHGLGSGAIDAGLNHYVASHFSARHMNWLHASYSLGAMAGPLIMTAALTRFGSWRLGYMIVASTLLFLAILFLTTQRHWNNHAAATTGDASGATSAPISAGEALRNRTVQLHMVLFFIYTGLEVAIGQWSFTVLTESRSVSPEIAGIWVSIYWASILAGRIGFGFIVDRVNLDSLIRVCMIVATLGAGLLAWDPWQWAAPLALGLAGLGLAVIFPCLMTRTPQRVGKIAAAHAIGFQVGAAMIGAAAFPSLAGAIAQNFGLHYVAGALLTMAVVLLLLHEVLLAKR